MIVEHPQVHNLKSYDYSIRFIGTKNCATCVGVYFEITGNRLFCAHINAGQFLVDKVLVEPSVAQMNSKILREQLLPDCRAMPKLTAGPRRM